MKKIVENIKNSKKYGSVYIKTIERIVADCIVRFGEKRAENEAKNLLHQIWGAYYSSRPDFEKILNKIETEAEKLQLNSNLQEVFLQNEHSRSIILPILRLQSSVQERVGVLEEFYKKIFAITGIPNSIIDHACGLNPLTIPWMSLPSTTTYKAYDIDEEEIKFLKLALNSIHCATKAEFALGDVFLDEFEDADVVFMLKLLPCLEHQKKGSSIEVLKKQNCKYIVVSFPIRSIGGKEKGMVEFYRNSFMFLVENQGWKISEILFNTELVFVVEK
jgi:16S rRNA (guanine(1405)-N(7))-methyltransferase